ncbi:MAG: ABC transporter permease [Bacteroidales bacterium]|uniref:ABC transporter permease n=1 Tax=Porphyromonas sp. TaxID=1924944 RepID=UPI002977D505|nr:ABC transporter permease [Porphyromonas sp.]MDD7438723.1 ABC transporter permease [Bacteroidales bacterium]MDY3066981.1 ABC transporter permease [Porphyromonas sp.]
MNAYFQELTNSLQNNKLRTFLTGFSIAWGIVILIVMLGAGRGVENGIRSMVETTGANQMEVSMSLSPTQKAYAGYKEGRQPFLTPSQLDYLRGAYSDRVDLIELSVSNFLTASTTFGSLTVQLNTRSWGEQSFNKLELQRGRLFSRQEHEEGARVALLSEGHVSSFFASGDDPIGQMITMMGITFKIVGTVKAPTPFFGVVYIPLNTYSGLYPNNLIELKNFAIYPKVGQAKYTQQLLDEMKQTVQQITKVDPTDPYAVYIQSSADQAKSMDLVFLSLQILLWIMGIGSLSIGTIGVSNIMHVTIQERMREIGIRKAIGAKPKDIMRLVLGESLLLSIVAGSVGLIVGIGLIHLIDYLSVVNKWGQQVVPVGASADDVMTLTLFSNPEVNFGVALGALIVLVVAGLLAGYGPAKKAIKIPAVVAMRDTK